MAFSIKTLLPYRPESSRNVTFYYRALTGAQQDLYRDKCGSFADPFAFVRYLFQSHVVFFVLHTGLATETAYTWPTDLEAQEDFMQDLAGDTIVEVGSVILGWVRGKDEEEEDYFIRVLTDLGVSIRSSYPDDEL